MATLVGVIDQTDTTDQYGQIYVTFPDTISHAIASVAGTGQTRVPAMVHCWVSGNKQATVKLWDKTGSVLASHAVEVEVAAWS